MIAAFVAAFLLLFRLVVRTSGELGGIAGILWQLAGWGSYFIILTIAGVGIYLMLRQMNLPFRLKMNQIVGFETAVVPAGEARKPRRDIPRALVKTIFAITLFNWRFGRGNVT